MFIFLIFFFHVLIEESLPSCLIFSSVDSLGRILAANIVNRGAGYMSIPSIAVADAGCLCQLQVGYQALFMTVILSKFI